MALTKKTKQTYIEVCETLKGKGSWWISSVIGDGALSLRPSVPPAPPTLVSSRQPSWVT